MKDGVSGAFIHLCSACAHLEPRVSRRCSAYSHKLDKYAGYACFELPVFYFCAPFEWITF